MEGPEIKAVEAVIDNGSFGKRTLRFETGRLAQQADGAVAAYLDDDSMILSTTTAGSSPKENYDFSYLYSVSFYHLSSIVWRMA